MEIKILKTKKDLPSGGSIELGYDLRNGRYIKRSNVPGVDGMFIKEGTTYLDEPSWKEAYKNHLNPNKISQDFNYDLYKEKLSNKEIKELIRKQAKKEAMLKAGGFATASALATYGGVKAYQHYKDKKNSENN